MDNKKEVVELGLNFGNVKSVMFDLPISRMIRKGSMSYRKFL